MTSSVPTPGDSMTSLHPDDIFLVNRDVDGNQKDYETYKVPYSEVSKAFTGPIGPEGDIGATGATGNVGPQGAGVRVLGYFDTYDELVQFGTDNFATHKPGDMYVVGNDYKGNSSGNPGQSFCDTPSSPTDISCKKNVAYVWAVGVPNHGRLNSFVRIAQLTGDPGATGPHFNNLTQVIDDQTDAGGKYDYTLQFRDTITASETYDPLDPVDLVIPDVRGATGSTGPHYDTIDYSETITGDVAGGNYSKEYTLTFKDTTTYPDGFAGLAPFTTKNLVGATGAGVGAQGSTGATGPYFDVVEFVEDGVVTGDGQDYDAIKAIYKDSTGNIPDSPSILNVRGPRGPQGGMDGITDPLDPEDPDAPWVHKGKDCNDKYQNVNEPIYGIKSICHTLQFTPCDFNQQIVRWVTNGAGNPVQSANDFVMIQQRGLPGGQGYTTDGFTIKREGQGTSPGLTLAFERGSGSPQVGIKVATPAYAVDAKGVLAASQIFARPNGKAGQVFNEGTKYTIAYLETTSNQYYFKGIGGKSTEFVFNGKLLVDTQKNGFRISNGAIANKAGEYLKRNGSDGSVCKSPTKTFSIPSSTDSEYTVGAVVDGSSATRLIKSLKPRFIEKEGFSYMGLSVDDLGSEIRSKIVHEYTEYDEREGSFESVMSLMILSIQKLEERITALETRS